MILDGRSNCYFFPFFLCFFAAESGISFSSFFDSPWCCSVVVVVVVVVAAAAAAAAVAVMAAGAMLRSLKRLQLPLRPR